MISNQANAGNDLRHSHNPNTLFANVSSVIKHKAMVDIVFDNSTDGNGQHVAGKYVSADCRSTIDKH